MTLDYKHKSEQKKPVGKYPSPDSSAELSVDQKQKKRIETKQAMRPLLNTAVIAQRQATAPLLQAISLQRVEEQYLGTEQQSLQRKIANLGELPRGAVQEAIQRQLETKVPPPALTRPQTPNDWVTVMRQKAAKVDGKSISEREAMHLQTLQCQVADHLNQGYRKDRQTPEARNAEYGGMLAG